MERLPFFKTWGIICIDVLGYVRFSLLLPDVDKFLHEHGLDICLETVSYRPNRVDQIYVSDARMNPAHSSAYSHFTHLRYLTKRKAFKLE